METFCSSDIEYFKFFIFILLSFFILSSSLSWIVVTKYMKKVYFQN